MALEYTIELTRVATTKIKVRADSMKEAEEKARYKADNLPGSINDWFVSKVSAKKIPGQGKQGSVLDFLKQVSPIPDNPQCRGRDRADGVFDSTCLHCSCLADNPTPTTSCLCAGDNQRGEK